MKRFVRLAVGAGAVLGLSTLVAPVVAGADPPGPAFGEGPDHVVFVQTDNTSGNQVVAYDRGTNGSLTLAGTYNTGGVGGQLTGSVVDHLASQGSLSFDPGSRSLYAVNAGSNTVSVFAVRGDRLFLRQVVNSGGAFPVSVAVHGALVEVLNAENGGSRTGLRELLRPPLRRPRVEPSPRSRPHGNAAVREHTRAGRILAGRLPADRDDQGQWE